MPKLWGNDAEIDNGLDDLTFTPSHQKYAPHANQCAISEHKTPDILHLKISATLASAF